jgi:hypothetical protein
MNKCPQELDGYRSGSFGVKSGATVQLRYYCPDLARESADAQEHGWAGLNEHNTERMTKVTPSIIAKSPIVQNLAVFCPSGIRQNILSELKKNESATA